MCGSVLLSLHIKNIDTHLMKPIYIYKTLNEVFLDKKDVCNKT